MDGWTDGWMERSQDQVKFYKCTILNANIAIFLVQTELLPMNSDCFCEGFLATPLQMPTIKSCLEQEEVPSFECGGNDHEIHSNQQGTHSKKKKKT